MVHGRGATAADILTLVSALDVSGEGFAFLAPQACSNTWYPNSFLAPIPSNEPGISSGLKVIADVIATLGTAGIPEERVILLGFSQGACLSAEFAARNARRYGGVVCLSGGLIGPDGTRVIIRATFQAHPSSWAAATSTLIFLRYGFVNRRQ